MSRIHLFLLMIGVGLAVQAQERFEGYAAGFSHDVLALQVQLDRRNLSCNCVDGCWGMRTEIALVTWQTLNKEAVTGVPTAAILEKLGGDTNVLCQYTITTNDHAQLGPFPDDWEDRAKLPALNYETILEMLAERSHASQRLVERLNPACAWPNPPAGTEVTLPDCTPHLKPQKAGSIRISLGRMEVTVFNGQGELVALFPCSIARDKAKRPVGDVTIKAVAPNPTYVYDPQLFEPGGPKTTKRIIPAGPNNPVGQAWISLSLQGYGIHGTPAPEKIGHAESKGCFRLANWNARKLIQMASIGVPILIEEE